MPINVSNVFRTSNQEEKESIKQDKLEASALRFAAEEQLSRLTDRFRRTPVAVAFDLPACPACEASSPCILAASVRGMTENAAPSAPAVKGASREGSK